MGPRSIAAALCLVTLLLYAPVIRHDFVIYDDPVYVVDNPHVRAGLSLGSVRWALGSLEASNWHPLTWLSHMGDCQYLGMDPGRHHAVSLALHAASAVLLLAFLQRTTGALWRSAFVAALFAWHPLHVESVAWIAERKDVLSGLFFMVTLLAHARYAAQPSRWRYGAIAVSLSLGLMAKPMLVTLPVILLLLDVWPLRRVDSDGTRAAVPLRRLILEKVPLLGLSAISAILTFVAQSAGGALIGLERLPVGARTANALLSIAGYVGETFWPSGLSVFYPYSSPPDARALVGAAVLLTAISAAAWGTRSRAPAIAVGWLWYLVMLAPVLGLVQAGAQRMADRYTYLPLVGVFIMLAWGLAFLATSTRLKAPVILAAVVALCLCLALTRLQLRHWRDSVALFQRATEVAPESALAHVNLGSALLAVGDVPRAAENYLEASRLEPEWFPARFNAGTALATLGRLEEARQQLIEAVRLEPSSALAHFQLASVLDGEGLWTDATREYRATLKLAPGHVAARTRLAALEAGSEAPR